MFGRFVLDRFYFTWNTGHRMIITITSAARCVLSPHLSPPFGEADPASDLGLPAGHQCYRFATRASGHQGRRLTMNTHPNRTKRTGERAVLVTTSHRGVFFGYAIKTDGVIIKLRRARNCISWQSENKGFLGLANMGPLSSARIGPFADIELRDITCVAECSEEATKAWESAPWSR